MGGMEATRNPAGHDRSFSILEFLEPSINLDLTELDSGKDNIHSMFIALKTVREKEDVTT